MNSKENEQPADVIGDILNIVHNSVILVDPAERIFFANNRTAEMFRAHPDQLKNLDFSELFMPEDREFMLPNILLLTRRKQEFETEIMLRCLDGGSFLGILFCSVFSWDNDECIAITIHDSSKMKAIERTLRHSERVAFLGHMLDEISHQVRNPIQVIGGLARRMKGTVGTNERYMDTIVRESGRLEKLLDTLNAFIRLSRPRTSIVFMAELFRVVQPRLEKIAVQHGISIKYHYDEIILSKAILADLVLIVEALEVVVTNACESYGEKYPGDSIELWLFDPGQPDCPGAIRIIDHGCGIKAESLPQVTTHFFTNKTGHIGMGLTFAQRIAEEQNCQMEIVSVEGQGTNVTFFLKKERRRPLRTERLE